LAAGLRTAPADAGESARATDDAPAGGAPAVGACSWEALGTTVVLRVVEPAALASARAAVERELDAIDLACSRFRADSELVALNARAGHPVRVSPLLLEAVKLALRGAELTGGDVDPTIGRALELAGYDRDWRLLQAPAGDDQPGGASRAQPAAGSDPPRLRARLRPGWQAVRVIPRDGTVRVPAGVSLDLGASAKAWAADRAAMAAAAAGGCGALVGIGGDIAVAGPPPRDGWAIHVTDDHRSDASAPGQTVTIRSGGLATSSTTVRRWQHGGHTMHHIIDPASGAPVRDTWRTVSVAADSCADANIAATAALVRSRAAVTWLDQLGLPARLVAPDGTVTTVGGWPAP
jgi:thiamine biosynthesis lipoprotein